MALYLKHKQAPFAISKLCFKARPGGHINKSSFEQIYYICFQMTVWLQNQLLILHGFILISKCMSKVKLECLISKTEIHVALLLLHHLPCRFFSDIQTIHTFSENLVFLSRSFCIPPASHSSITKYIRCKCEEMHNIYIKPIMIKNC